MDLTVVPIQIRPDLIVKVQIPWDLTAEEAERIARVVVSMARVTADLYPQDEPSEVTIRRERSQWPDHQ